MFSLTELGKRLREAREEKGLTLDDVQEMTKIQKRYLIGIEQGNYGMIPGKFYVRAFIKQYAEAVGLNPEQIFDEYRYEIPSVYEDDLPEELSRMQSRKELSKGTSKFFEILPKILVAIFVIGFVLFIWFFWQNYAKNKDMVNQVDRNGENVNLEEKGNLPKTDQEIDKEENNEINSGETNENINSEENSGNEPLEEQQTQSIQVVETSGNNTTYELTNAEKFTLKIAATANGRSWISVNNGAGKTLFQGEIANGESKEFDFTNDGAASIRIGRAIDTEIYINDEKVDYALSPSEYIVQNIIIRYVKD